MNNLMDGFLEAVKNSGVKQGEDLNFFSINNGKNKYRFVPYNDILYHKTTEHFTKHFGIVDKESKKGVSVLCTMDKYKKCPFCEEYSRAVQLDQGDAFKKAPQNFYYFYVINQEGIPGILKMDELCFNLFGKYIQKCLQDEDYGKRNLLSLEEGSFIIIEVEREEGGKKKRIFSFSKIDRPQLITPDEVKKLFNGYPRIDTLKKIHGPDKLKLMLDTGRLDVLRDNDDKNSENKAERQGVPTNEQRVVEQSGKDIGNEEKSIIDQLKASLDEGDSDDISY